MNSSGDEEQLGGAASFSLSAMESSTDTGRQSPLSDMSSPLLSFTCHQRLEHFSSMEACHAFYERRLKTLERFRHRLTAHQQQSDLSSPGQQDVQEQIKYRQLQSDMMELMENDVRLMLQLMALGERIEELKTLALFTISASESSSSSSHVISPTSSMISLDGVCCEESIEHDENEDALPNREVPTSKSGPVPATDSTMDNAQDEALESGLEESDLGEELNCVTVQNSTLCTRRVYFSRQNSILRIPIPPSRGLRSKTVADLQQHAPAPLKRGHSTACETFSSDDTASCASSTLEKSRGAGWYARRKAGRDLLNSETTLSSRKQAMRTDIGSTAGDCTSSIPPPYHASQSSCDSGVHHLNSSVDLLDEETLIYV